MISAIAAELDARDSGALFSPCRRWRYALWRSWDRTLPWCAFVGLNPSTADELKDDPTIRRCRNFARDWGYGSMIMLNVFALRSTDPRGLRVNPTASIGPLNNEYLLHVGRAVDLIVAAWGVHAHYQDRQTRVLHMFAQAGLSLHHLGLTKNGFPRHPLYLSSETKPTPWVTSYNGTSVRQIGEVAGAQ